MLIKRSERRIGRGASTPGIEAESERSLDRRSFLRRSGLIAGSLAGLGVLPLGSVRQAAAGAPPPPGATVARRKNICTHCSVGCSVIAEVANDVWIGQEPDFDSPINRGSHCCKGAAVRDDVAGDRRLRYPVKLVDGQWNRIPWDQAIEEIGGKLMEVRAKSGPDSVYWLGSAKFTNEAAYLNRKFAAFWGTNNSDHQARICHSTTVTGVANTWGYGAMTNSYNDIRNAKTIMVMGGNPAEAHPVSLQHILEGKELNRANMIVIDPRMTRTAAHATEYVRVRPGTHIPTIYGMLWHILENGWEDKEFISQRVYGLDDLRAEVAKWPPAEVERVTGLPEAQVKRVAEVFRQGTALDLIWAMGQTQFATGTANVRASCLLLLATGNVGGYGSGANIFRGHTNVQGATDLGLDVTTLPLYYGLSEEAWRHWCRVWEVDYDWMRSRFADKSLMEAPGIPSTRWFDATAPAQGPGQPAGYVEGDVRHGTRRQYHYPHAGIGPGNREARPSGRLRSVSDQLGSAFGPEEWDVSVAGLHQLRNGRVAHRLQSIAPVGRTDRETDLRIEERLRHHVLARAQAGLCRPDCSRTSRSRTARCRRRTYCARSIAAAGPPAIAASRPSASRRICATKPSSTW